LVTVSWVQAVADWLWLPVDWFSSLLHPCLRVSHIRNLGYVRLHEALKTIVGISEVRKSLALFDFSTVKDPHKIFEREKKDSPSVDTIPRRSRINEKIEFGVGILQKLFTPISRNYYVLEYSELNSSCHTLFYGCIHKSAFPNLYISP
jgi:hypothetical protein